MPTLQPPSRTIGSLPEAAELAASADDSGQRIGSGAALEAGADAFVTARRNGNRKGLQIEHWDIEGDVLVVRVDRTRQRSGLDRSESISTTDIDSGQFAAGARDRDGQADAPL